MKNKIVRKITITCLSLLMLISACSPVFAEGDTAGFVDVKAGAWYASSVEYVAENGIMVGTAANRFSPDVEFSRAMTVQVLARLSGDELSGYTTTEFPDVPDGEWYTSAVAWAVDKGVAKGDGKIFDPNAPVTREQLARMIAQFAAKYEISNMFAAGPDNIEVFIDAADTSTWAQEDIEWAVYNGIISGTGKSKLSPKGIATRAQAAKIFYYLHYMMTEGIIPPDTADFDAITMTESDNPFILCWGDSMTAGYPDYLRDNYGLRARNFSSGGDIAEHIAMKQGGIPFYAAPFTIPASKEAVQVVLLDNNYETIVSMADLGNRGLSPAYIAGIEGNLYCGEDGLYYFSRMDKAPYEEVKVDRLTRVVTKGMTSQNSNDIHIIFSGPSNGYTCDEAYKLIETQTKMIEYMGSDKYIIISLTSEYYLNGVSKFNADLAEHYGEHFLDFRTFLMTEGFEAAGIEPTEQDLKDLAADEIPSSFRSDLEHGNHIFDSLLADQLYLKLVELGYIEPTV